MSDQQKPENIPPSVAPYLLRAFWQWIADQGHTPHILVNANYEGVIVPKHAITADGRITLNIADRSAKFLKIDDDSVSFGAAFSGRHYNIYIPMAAIVAIYDRETSNGFALENFHPKQDAPKQPFGFRPPALAVVSNTVAPEQATNDGPVETVAEAPPPPPAEEAAPATGRSRAHLRVIK